MDITERISRIKDYFKTMQADANVIYIAVTFPDNWRIYNEVEEKFSIKVRPGNDPGEYYFFANMDDGFDVLFDAIEYNVTQMKEGIERAQLLNAKVKELKDLFSNREISIGSLRTVKFTYLEDITSTNPTVYDFLADEKKNKENKKGK